MKNPFIYKRKNGYYYVAYFLNGKRISKSTSAKNKSEANKFFLALKLQYKNNSNLTIEQFKIEILNYSKHNHSPKTTIIYRNTFNHFQNVVKKKYLNDITTNDIEKFKNSRVIKVSPSTVNIDLMNIKSSFNIAVKFGYINNSPAKEVKLLRIPQKEILAFSKYELEKFLSVIDIPKFKSFVLFAYYTGCRISEILNLEWKDIDSNSNSIVIRNKPNFKTKTGNIRYIPVSNNLLELLNGLNKNDNYVFADEKNRKFYRQHIQLLFRHYRKISSTPAKFTMHSLRHTFITNLVNKNVNINYIKELAGHTKLETTLRYIHINTENLRNAVNSIDKM